MQLVNSKTKVCFKCKIEKPRNCFYLRKRYLHSYCKTCITNSIDYKNKLIKKSIVSNLEKIDILQNKMNSYWDVKNLSFSRRIVKKIEKLQYACKRRIEILREQLKE